MQIHNIKPKTRRKRVKSIGRGGKRGTYSGRGIKGQKAHAGRKIRPELRDIIKKLPKKRGYRFHSIKNKPVVVSIATLDKIFNSEESVSPQTLAEKRIIRKKHNKKFNVKIVGSSMLRKKLKISHCLISRGAQEAIEKAGGTVSR